MKKELLSSLILSVFCIVLFAGAYPLLILGIAQLMPEKGHGKQIRQNGRIYYADVVQKFTDDMYFWSRPSAVDYNAAGSGGSNKGPINPEYLATVHQRIDTFLAHNPGIRVSDIPSDMVTASGSGLDPHISIQGARVQALRVANARHLTKEQVNNLITMQTEHPLLGILGPTKVNILKLNIALDYLK